MKGSLAEGEQRLPFAATSFFGVAAFFAVFALDLAFGLADDFVTPEALDLVTLGVAAFFGAAGLGVVFVVAFLAGFLVGFFGVVAITSSIKRSGGGGSEFVSDRVLRVGCGITLEDLALGV